MGFEPFDVVVVPFPFTDRQTSKRRPALVLSASATFNNLSGHVVLAMITSARHSDWPLDVQIHDLDAAGLPNASVVRMKLFTLDARLVERCAGRLAGVDREAVRSTIATLIALEP